MTTIFPFCRWNRERTKSELAVDRKSKRRHSAQMNNSLDITTEEQSPCSGDERTSVSTPATPQVAKPADPPSSPQFNRRTRSRRHELSKQHLQMQAEKVEETKPPAEPMASPKPWLLKKYVHYY